MCSAALEALRAAQTLSSPTQQVKSDEAGCRPSELLDSLIGGVLANQRDVWEGRNTVCALFFHALRSVVMFWSTGARLAVMSIQDELIYVCLVHD